MNPDLNPRTGRNAFSETGTAGPPDYSFIGSRINYLKKLIAVKAESLSGKPDGFLKIQTKGNHDYYFQIIRGGSPSCNYLNKTKSDIIHQLAQKGYDRKVLFAAREELKALETFQKQLPDIPAEAVYKHLPDNRKSLIRAVIVPDELFLKQWMDTGFTPKPFSDGALEFYTERDERVRSKSEVILANLLIRKGLPYKYECPLTLKSGGIIHPDFTILDLRRRREIYLEHLGMMDDSYYSESAVDRIALYEENGIFPGDRLILTHETRRHPLNIKAVDRLLDFHFR